MSELQASPLFMIHYGLNDDISIFITLIIKVNFIYLFIKQLKYLIKWNFIRIVYSLLIFACIFCLMINNSFVKKMQILLAIA